MNREEKAEFDREDAICDERDDRECEGEKCPECGAVMRYEVISCDADGNRPEWGFVCPNCD